MRVPKQLPIIDSSKVGKKISRGGHHDVYRYATNQVIKIPHRPFRFLYSNEESLLQELSLIEQYFPGLAIPTTIVTVPKTGRHGIVQEYIKDGLFLTRETVQLVRTQLQRIVVNNKEMVAKEQMSLDILGGSGYLSFLQSLVIPGVSAHASNLLVVKSRQGHRIRLVDTELLRLSWPKATSRDITIFILSYISYWINVIVLRFVFGLKI